MHKKTKLKKEKKMGSFHKIDILNSIKKLAKEEKKRPQTSGDEGFVEDMQENLDRWEYKCYEILLDVNSGQNNVWYQWEIRTPNGQPEYYVDTGDLESDMKEILFAIDKNKVNKLTLGG